MKLDLKSIARMGASTGAMMLALTGTAALAQPAMDEDTQTGDGGIAEIIVTAQRSETKLQDTPLSIVAVGGPELERQGTDSLAGFDTFIPNVTIGGTAAQGNAIINVAIRGIGGAPQGFSLTVPGEGQSQRQPVWTKLALAGGVLLAWYVAGLMWDAAREQDLRAWEARVAEIRPQAMSSVALRQKLDDQTHHERAQDVDEQRGPGKARPDPPHRPDIGEIAQRRAYGPAKGDLKKRRQHRGLMGPGRAKVNRMAVSSHRGGSAPAAPAPRHG